MNVRLRPGRDKLVSFARAGKLPLSIGGEPIEYPPGARIIGGWGAEGPSSPTPPSIRFCNMAVPDKPQLQPLGVGRMLTCWIRGGARFFITIRRTDPPERAKPFTRGRTSPIRNHQFQGLYGHLRGFLWIQAGYG